MTGVPAVLLLRGARSPYVLVDEPREVVLLRDAAVADRPDRSDRDDVRLGDPQVQRSRPLRQRMLRARSGYNG